MNKEFLIEILKDLEVIKNIMSNKIQQIKSIVGEQNFTESNNFNNEFENKRNEIMKQMEKIRNEAFSQIKTNIPENIPRGFPENIPPDIMRHWQEKNK